LVAVVIQLSRSGRRLDNISFLGLSRMDNLLKAHR